MNDKQNRFLSAFEPIKRNLWKYCLSVAKDSEDAKDLLQDTIETAYKSFDTLKSPEAFLSFLFTIASRKNAQRYDKSKRECKFDPDQYESLIDPSLSPDKKVDIGILYAAMDSLPYEQKESLTLCEIIGLSHKEAAEVQGISVDAIRQRLHRGKQKLKEILNPEISDNEIFKTLNQQPRIA
jgi:RNA polymerase sigma-70 factor (ECF subfamily)